MSADKSPRNTSTRTSLEVVTRRIVDQAAAELLAYLDKLPEAGNPKLGVGSAADTREQILALRDKIEHYLGGK